jgi:methylphosphotriester-DNA--protein-cysteine methyltransferase
MTGLAVMENVRRYRAIASLCRQTAAFRPVQRCSLLTQAEEWEHRAVAELERHFDGTR